MDIRRVTAEDWQALRDLRLRALADSPDAFVTTLADVQDRSDDGWREWGVRAAEGDSAFFVDDEFTGMAGGFVQDDGIPMLVGMWVAPERRGSGL